VTLFRGVDHAAPDLLHISCTLSIWDGETRSTPSPFPQLRGRMMVIQRLWTLGGLTRTQKTRSRP
jgi:hypothetical protein